MAALPRWQPVGSSAGSAAPGLTAGSADCRHPINRKIHDLGNSARRGRRFRSHEHRYDTDPAYRLACQAAKPNTQTTAVFHRSLGPRRRLGSLSQDRNVSTARWDLNSACSPETLPECLHRKVGLKFGVLISTTPTRRPGVPTPY